MATINSAAFDNVGITIAENDVPGTLDWTFHEVPAHLNREFFDFIASDDGHQLLTNAAAAYLFTQGRITEAQAREIIQSVPPREVQVR
ncbi:hypothetical protein SEA_REINDEER_81 [Mycobacterium phage Reindeer]|uniref:Uncharacterized protein n=1 Tax=Mycobacterium phage Reindeer TaxID=2762283 RepID=A0A7G8LI19_9CAUD|nr:hypothetical protein J4U05_gp081 [Mycobacterium phage Reindeer]QNJ56891.1 hypothetical protein SEA_REINDEER_81 [Mycobacterium phage Reindeer]